MGLSSVTAGQSDWLGSNMQAQIGPICSASPARTAWKSMMACYLLQGQLSCVGWHLAHALCCMQGQVLVDGCIPLLQVVLGGAAVALQGVLDSIIQLLRLNLHSGPQMAETAGQAVPG